jgi:hypothetical protein
VFRESFLEQGEMSRRAEDVLISGMPQFTAGAVRCARGCGHQGARVKRPSTLEHIRDLWTLNGVRSTCTAAIWRNDFGLELRVENNGDLVESRLSRVGEGPLLLIADQVKANLIEQGWTEQPNAT